MSKLRILLAFCLMAEQFLIPVAGLFAQGAEPAAGSDFAQDLQGAGESGEPLPEQQSAGSSQVMPQGGAMGGQLDSIQLGAIPKETPMYDDVESVSPLDRKIGPIRLKAAPLATFLDVVSAQSKVNFIVTEGVETKTITVFLKKTTVREALELLLRVKGLTYQRIGKSSTYVVQKRSAEMPNLITKIYTLNYIPLIPIASIESDISAVTSEDVSAGSQQQDTQTPQAGADEDKGIAIIKILKSVLSKLGKLSTDPRTNTLIITDVPEVFPQVEQIIAELDKKAPQISIEAQITEINTDRMNELGIEWGGSRGEMAFFAGPARLTDYGLRSGFFSGDNWKYFYPKTFASANSAVATAPEAIDPVFSTKSPGPRGTFYGVFSLAQLQAMLRALVSRGEARYLGKPKIIAMNNKTAVIMVTREAAVGQTSSALAGGTGTESTSVERRRVGLMLKVTPQVNKEGYITLIVQPSYSDTTPSAIGTTILDPISRGASTMVRVKNGATVVIGGMLSSTEQKTVRKVPLLGYIPIVGWLFTSYSSRRINTDLVIFVTPTIQVD